MLTVDITAKHREARDAKSTHMHNIVKWVKHQQNRSKEQSRYPLANMSLAPTELKLV